MLYILFFLSVVLIGVVIIIVLIALKKFKRGSTLPDEVKVSKPFEAADIYPVLPSLWLWLSIEVDKDSKGNSIYKEAKELVLSPDGNVIFTAEDDTEYEVVFDGFVIGSVTRVSDGSEIDASKFSVAPEKKLVDCVKYNFNPRSSEFGSIGHPLYNQLKDCERGVNFCTGTPKGADRKCTDPDQMSAQKSIRFCHGFGGNCTDVNGNARAPGEKEEFFKLCDDPKKGEGPCDPPSVFMVLGENINHYRKYVIGGDATNLKLLTTPVKSSPLPGNALFTIEEFNKSVGSTFPESGGNYLRIVNRSTGLYLGASQFKTYLETGSVVHTGDDSGNPDPNAPTGQLSLNEIDSENAGVFWYHRPASLHYSNALVKTSNKRPITMFDVHLIVERIINSHISAVKFARGFLKTKENINLNYTLAARESVYDEVVLRGLDQIAPDRVPNLETMILIMDKVLIESFTESQQNHYSFFRRKVVATTSNLTVTGDTSKSFGFQGLLRQFLENLRFLLDDTRLFISGAYSNYTNAANVFRVANGEDINIPTGAESFVQNVKDMEQAVQDLNELFANTEFIPERFTKRLFYVGNRPINNYKEFLQDKKAKYVLSGGSPYGVIREGVFPESIPFGGDITQSSVPLDEATAVRIANGDANAILSNTTFRTFNDQPTFSNDIDNELELNFTLITMNSPNTDAILDAVE